jgi:hypothetical protein
MPLLYEYLCQLVNNNHHFEGGLDDQKNQIFCFEQKMMDLLCLRIITMFLDKKKKMSHKYN